jgi:hypothetical protein
VPPGIPERDEEIWRRYSQGERQAQLAKALGMSQPSICEAIARHRKTIPAHVREELIQSELEFHLRLRNEIMRVFEGEPTPVLSWRDGTPVSDPDTGATIVEHAGRLQAARAALEVSKHLARLAGLEAPTRVELSGSEIAAADALAAQARAYLDGADPPLSLDAAPHNGFRLDQH